MLGGLYMGFRSFGSLLMVFLILMFMFGTARLKDVGNDLAIAIRNFRKALQDDDEGKKQ
jgi:sec-independent protein translocase protein TatA